MCFGRGVIDELLLCTTQIAFPVCFLLTSCFLGGKEIVFAVGNVGCLLISCFLAGNRFLNVKMEDGALLCAGEGNAISLESLSCGDFLNRRFMVSCVNLAPDRIFRGRRELHLGSPSELEELWSSRLPADGRGAWISLELVLICSSSRRRSVSFLFL